MDELHTLTEPLIKNVKEMAPHVLQSKEIKIDEDKMRRSNVQLLSSPRFHPDQDARAPKPEEPVHVVNLGQVKEGTVDQFIAAQSNKQRRKLVAKVDIGQAHVAAHPQVQ